VFNIVNSYENANIVEEKLCDVFNEFIKCMIGYKFKTDQNRFKTDIILQKYRITCLKIEIESSDKNFLSRRKNKIILPYGDITIQPRREKNFIENPDEYYIRIRETNAHHLNKDTLAYVNINKNILNFKRLPMYNKLSTAEKENFFCDNFNTKYQGFYGTIPECIKWIAKKSHISFYFNSNEKIPKENKLTKYLKGNLKNE